MPDLLDIEVAGKLIGAGRCKAYEMSCTGELPTVNIGRKKFVPKWELIMKFRLMPGAELIRLLVKEMGKEEVLKIIEKECI
jgi:hypothetical protein